MKTRCSSCGQNIEYNLDTRGQYADCPSCGNSVMLNLYQVEIPKLSRTEQVSSKRSVPERMFIFLIIGVIVAVIMSAAGMAWGSSELAIALALIGSLFLSLVILVFPMMVWHFFQKIRNLVQLGCQFLEDLNNKTKR